MNTAEIIENSTKVVIKIGSVLLVDQETGLCKTDWLDRLAEDINVLIKKNIKPLIVTSGAIALGRNALNINLSAQKTALKLEQQQAAAAVGTTKLAQAYSQSFQKRGLEIGLALLSPRETEERRTHLNARSTINTMLENGIIPIINENDTIATSEIRFGDNDRLGARVAQMIGADTLILLSTIDGLYTAPPEDNPTAEHIPYLTELTPQHEKMASDKTNGLSTGGMTSKLIAAKIAMNAGCNMIIADGQNIGSLSELTKSTTSTKATIFKACNQPQKARKKWLASHIHTSGTIHIDIGAHKALKAGKSLLPVGVKRISGEFKRGDSVEIRNTDNQKIGIGLAGHDAENAQKIIGLKSTKAAQILGYEGREEMIHSDNLVLTDQ